MPTAELGDVTALLPWWVVAGAWAAVPLLACTIGLVMIWLCARCNTVRATGVHWTEVARQRFAARAVLGGLVVIHLVLVTVVTASCSGELTGPAAAVRTIAAPLFLWLASRGIVFHHARRLQPRLTVRDFAAGQAALLVLLLPIWLAIGMLVFGPRTFAESPAYFVSFYVVGLVGMMWLLFGGGLTVARWLGLVVAADARLVSAVAAVTECTGHVVRRVWILRAPVANAAAFPRTNELLVTTRALAELNDAELKALLLHEVGHLRETRRDGWWRMVGVLPLVVIALGGPMAAAFGLLAPLAVIVVLLLVSRLLGGHARRLETAADRHAHEHEAADDAGVYARTLERLYACNLTPAVMRGERRAHPHLYDRMLAAGVTPDYERPLPPPRRTGRALLFVALTWLVYVAATAQLRTASKRIYASPDAAYRAVVLSGGSQQSLGALGYHWVSERPAAAAVVLAYLSGRSAEPEYPAWLAMALASTNEPAARASLQRAEQLCAEQPWLEDWQLETVEAAREWLPSK